MTADMMTKSKQFHVTMEAGEFRYGHVIQGGMPGMELVEWCDSAEEACDLCAKLNAVVNAHRLDRRPSPLVRAQTLQPSQQVDAFVCMDVGLTDTSDVEIDVPVDDASADDQDEFDVQQARLPPGCILWGNYGDGKWRVRNSIGFGIRMPAETAKEAVDKFLASNRVKE